jgi:hypothetical protein
MTPTAAALLLALAAAGAEPPAAPSPASAPAEGPGPAPAAAPGPAPAAAPPAGSPAAGPAAAGPPAAAAGRAGGIAALSDALAALPGRTPVRARIEHRLATRAGDEGARPEGVARATATAGPDGLQVSWSPDVLAQADREEQRRAADPEALAPTRDALADLRPLAIARALDAGPELLRLLERSELVEERAEAHEGAPARLLVLKVRPALSARERKYLSEVEATARIWVGADGLPVAAEQHVKASGRVLLVVGFESEQRETFRFARAGDRLVVVRHELDQRSEGAGDKGGRRAVTTLAVGP